MKIGIISVLYRTNGFPAIPKTPDTLTIGVVNEQHTFTGSVEGVDHVLYNTCNTGFGAATRQGAEIAMAQGCTHLLIINPDTEPDAQLLTQLIAGMERTGADMVQPVILCKDRERINTSGNTLVYVGISTCREFGSRTLPTVDQEILVVSGACLFITVKAWQQLDGFDDSFFLYQEDTDLSWRAALLGLKAVCIHDAFCVHDFELRLPSWKLHLLERNRIQMLLQNYEWKTLALLFPLGCIFEGGMLCYSLTQGFFLEKLQGYVEVLMRLPHILERRKIITQKRRLTDKQILARMDREVLEPSLQNILVQKVLNPLLRWYYLQIERTI